MFISTALAKPDLDAAPDTRSAVSLLHLAASALHLKLSPTGLSLSHCPPAATDPSLVTACLPVARDPPDKQRTAHCESPSCLELGPHANFTLPILNNPPSINDLACTYHQTLLYCTDAHQTRFQMAEIRRKLVIVGDGACGKTCLLM